VTAAGAAGKLPGPNVASVTPFAPATSSIHLVLQGFRLLLLSNQEHARRAPGGGTAPRRPIEAESAGPEF
jgi:hypothetical protein